MDKDNLMLKIGPIIVIIVCIVLGINTVILNLELSNEKIKASQLDTELAHYKVRVPQLSMLLNHNIEIVEDLQYSLNIAREDADDAIEEAAMLAQENTELRARLESASKALEGKVE